MTTSGVAAYNPSVGQIMRSALLKVGAIADGETPTPDQYANTLNSLEAMGKAWVASGIHLWTIEEAVLFLQVNQYRYLLGGNTTDHACDAWSWTQGALSSTCQAGAVAIPMATTAGMLVGDNIGIVLDSGATFWTTTTAVGATSVTLAAPLPSSSSAGNFTMDYPASAEIWRPLAIPKCRRLLLNGLNETPIKMVSRQEFMDLPNKTNPGAPNNCFYAPKLVQGEFYVWNVPINATWALRFTWYRPLEDFLAIGNTADFPQEWIAPLEWCLAREIMVDQEVPPARAQLIMTMATGYFEQVQGWDREETPIRFGVDFDGRG